MRILASMGTLRRYRGSPAISTASSAWGDLVDYCPDASRCIGYGVWPATTVSKVVQAAH